MPINATARIESVGIERRRFFIGFSTGNSRGQEVRRHEPRLPGRGGPGAAAKERRRHQQRREQAQYGNRKP